MTNKVFLYSHGGSGNHGCEALVRTTKDIIGNSVKTLYSNDIMEDNKYGLNTIGINIYPQNNPDISFLEKIIASLKIRLFHDSKYAEFINVKHMLKSKAVAVSIGGDNYCYPGFEQYCLKNDMFNSNDIKTALWGCSIEPRMLNDTLKNDLSKYSFISTRESITYDAIKKYNTNTYLYPDPAFALNKIDRELPNKLKNRKFIGLNLSPVVINSAENDYIVLENFEKLIKYIIDNTEYSIALIPHVIWRTSDDRKAMKPLLDKFSDTNRIVMIDDCNCMELKGFISKCDMFIGARTHSTIAAYSTFVPTLVVGYSVKALGIAKDIFGTYDNYVLPAQSLKSEDDLLNAYFWLNDNKDNIRSYLKLFMPQYINRSILAGKKFREVFGIDNDKC